MMVVRALISTVGELFQFLLARKLWWMVPMIFLLLVFSALIILGSASGLGPFIYTLF